MKTKHNPKYLIGLIIIMSFSTINSIFSQAIKFQYAQNGVLKNKQLDLDKKDFEIVGSDLVCKGKVAEFSVSIGETAKWSNGINAIKAAYTITKDTLIRAIVTNKYGCDFEITKSIKVADLPTKPIIQRFGDSLIVNNVVGNFEWYRNGLLFNVGLKFIRTSLEGDYTVKVIDENGCENISDVFKFIISSTDNLANGKFLFYPNPAQDKIWFKPSLDVSKEFHLKVYSVDGRIVPVHYNGEYLDISTFATGFYVIELADKNNSVSFQFIKTE